MDALRYLLILAACVAVTLPLELALGARVYRQPRRLLATLAPVVAVFVLWDLIAVERGHWWFSARYTTGLTVAGLPWEEWLFFLVVPLCALLTFEVLGHATRLLRRAETAGPRRGVAGPGLLRRFRGDRPVAEPAHSAAPTEPTAPQRPVAPTSAGARRGR
ncbi:lycopene cyclase domain-containing protein [Catellatospora sichuanensis]|uniref:lycopene cyclase domain-containing protein n=1 Tax=Catellatospora sichuanensis TaxID=1969805 RepID=UPI001183A3A5|nr:lycopene cyclase domain-containing protein [Catellatospora sichuanensis]